MGNGLESSKAFKAGLRSLTAEMTNAELQSLTDATVMNVKAEGIEISKNWTFYFFQMACEDLKEAAMQGEGYEEWDWMNANPTSDESITDYIAYMSDFLQGLPEKGDLWD